MLCDRKLLLSRSGRLLRPFSSRGSNRVRKDVPDRGQLLRHGRLLLPGKGGLLCLSGLCQVVLQG